MFFVFFFFNLCRSPPSCLNRWLLPTCVEFRFLNTVISCSHATFFLSRQYCQYWRCQVSGTVGGKRISLSRRERRRRGHQPRFHRRGAGDFGPNPGGERSTVTVYPRIGEKYGRVWQVHRVALSAPLKRDGRILDGGDRERKERNFADTHASILSRSLRGEMYVLSSGRKFTPRFFFSID